MFKLRCKKIITILHSKNVIISAFIYKISVPVPLVVYIYIFFLAHQIGISVVFIPVPALVKDKKTRSGTSSARLPHIDP